VRPPICTGCTRRVVETVQKASVRARDVQGKRSPAARVAVALSGLLLAAACTVGPEYRPPAVPIPAWRSAPPMEASLADLAWWELFRDSALRDLIQAALAANGDLRVAVARVAEARALAAGARAAQFPQLSGSLSYANQRYSGHRFPPIPAGLDLQTDDYLGHFDLTFELDLWGRLRRATEAARADLLTSEENRSTVVMTLVSDVAATYFSLLALDREAEIAARTLDSRRTSLELVRHRFEEGLTSELDVRRAEGELAAAAAIVPEVESRQAQAENRLSILVGQNPGPVSRGAPLDMQRLPPAVPAGLPAALLERRPDLQAAASHLAATTARIGEARAAFFPQITLTGLFGVESIDLAHAVSPSSRIWQVGPGLTVPIFNAGRLQANLNATEAREQQALAQYEQAVRQAFQDVEDALAVHQAVGRIRQERERQFVAAGAALQLAELRYENGLIGYLDVLDAQRQLFIAETNLAAIIGDQLIAVVRLYKALGGGWNGSAPDGKDASR